jgi:hypothetical protein
MGWYLVRRGVRHGNTLLLVYTKGFFLVLSWGRREGILAQDGSAGMKRLISLLSSKFLPPLPGVFFLQKSYRKAPGIFWYTSRVALHLTTLALLACSVFFLSACRRAMNHVCTTRPITFAPSFTHVQTVSHSHLCFTSNLDNKTLIREPFSFIQRVNIYIFRKFSGSFGKLLSIFQ